MGASKEVVFEGGPQPWVLDPSKHSQTSKLIVYYVNVKIIVISVIALFTDSPDMLFSVYFPCIFSCRLLSYNRSLNITTKFD